MEMKKTEERMVVIAEPNSTALDMVLWVKNWDNRFRGIAEAAIDKWNNDPNLDGSDFHESVKLLLEAAGYDIKEKKFEHIPY